MKDEEFSGNQECRNPGKIRRKEKVSQSDSFSDFFTFPLFHPRHLRNP
jgi:hypothetical protein